MFQIYTDARLDVLTGRVDLGLPDSLQSLERMDGFERFDVVRDVRTQRHGRQGHGEQHGCA